MAQRFHVSRRSFLIASAAAAGASWFDVPKILAADSTADWKKKYGGFPVGIQSYSLRGFGVEEAINKAGGELGLHRIEFFPGHYKPTGDQADVDKMNAMLKKWDMSISAHGVNRFTKDHAKNELLFKFAKLAGIPVLSADFEADAHESINKLVAQYDIKLACHNHGPKHRWKSPEDLLAQIGSLDPRIGACADLGHYIRSGQDPVEVIHKLKGRLWGVHLKDFADKADKTKGVILGKGHLDVVGVFKALKAVNFPADGALSLEYEENPKDPMAEIKENLAVAAEAAQKVAAG
jgi:sugar phosphate isomerase/epimerase